MSNLKSNQAKEKVSLDFRFKRIDEARDYLLEKKTSLFDE